MSDELSWKYVVDTWRSVKHSSAVCHQDLYLMGSTQLPSRRDVSVVSIVYAWALSAQKECICAHISCSFWFLGYGTRFRMRMSDSETQCLSSHHSTPLLKHLPSGVRRGGERTGLPRKCMVVPAYKTCTGGVKAGGLDSRP